MNQSWLSQSQPSDKFVLADNSIGRLFKSKNKNVESDYKELVIKLTKKVEGTDQ